MSRTKIRGGRQERKRIRSLPLAASERPIYPGMSGGRYLPLSQADIAKIHQTTLETLQSIGISQATPSGIEILTRGGCTLTEDGRLLFPASLVEDTIAKAPSAITLFGRDPDHDLRLEKNRVYFSTAGAAVHRVDASSRRYLDSTLSDLFKAARLVEQLDNVHMFQRTMIARDISDPVSMEANVAFGCMLGTRKHIGASWINEQSFDTTLAMLHTVAGSEKAWRERPFMSCSACFVVPPLRFAQDACVVMEAAARAGMPILLLAAGQAGATSPTPLAGAIVQEMAEVLAGLVYVNLISPGHPCILGPWPFVSDLRTGAMSGGSGEQAVLSAGCGQMGRFYDLPVGVPAGMTDSKLPDCQAGFEKGYTVSLAAHSGANLIYECAGMQASLLGFSLEGLIIDNDMLGAINRTVRGIEVSDDKLSLHSMRSVCLGGPHHFLGHEQTLELMQRDYVYPALAERLSPKEWVEVGSQDILQRAQRTVHELLHSDTPLGLSDDMIMRLQQQCDLKSPHFELRTQPHENTS